MVSGLIGSVVFSPPLVSGAGRQPSMPLWHQGGSDPGGWAQHRTGGSLARYRAAMDGQAAGRMVPSLPCIDGIPGRRRSAGAADDRSRGAGGRRGGGDALRRLEHMNHRSRFS
ncbi:hypothetical protein SBD_0010 [Streptomyces bottropensis ATCC 25435]|uniref:Uncharacterized protein n=1 Tax=Streptomyces bottropensis ATCC 25435 TaxID=1054862 RepID=M3F6U0_9ACTN|nr:hypothetical protein SBD_0010 [Streptomyces bottropensis ATCC 25435]